MGMWRNGSPDSAYMWASMQANACAPRLTFLALSCLYTSLEGSPASPALCLSLLPCFSSWTLTVIFPSPPTFSSSPYRLHCFQQQESLSCMSFQDPGPFLTHNPPPAPGHPMLHTDPCLSHPAPLNTFLAPYLFLGLHAAFLPHQWPEHGPEVMDGFQNFLVSPGFFEG